MTTSCTISHYNTLLFTGRFSMDPNRVLDVILQALESHFDQRHFFIPLLRSYPCAPSTFINILGFKYHTYHLVSPLLERVKC